MNVLWNEKEVEFLKNNYSNMYYKEIAKMLGRSCKSISRKAENLGLIKRDTKVWSDYEVKYLIENYNIIPPIKIAKYLDRTYQSVTLKAHILGLKVDYRYYEPNYNEEFFDVWSNELAWLVGIVLSDGHVSDPNNGRLVRVKMCDRDVIEKIKEMTNHTGEMGVFTPTNPKWSTSYIVEFWGNKVWQFFTDLGMDNHKSYNATFPIVLYKYISHVIRGVFDGDGSICLSKNTCYPFARVCGTKGVTDFIAAYMGLHHTSHPNSDVNITVQYPGNDAVSFLKYIYENSTKGTRMDRKYNKYLKILKKWWG